MNKFLTVAVASTIALSLAGCAPLADSPLNDEPGSVSVEDAPQAQTDSAEAETGDVELTAPEAEGNQASDGSMSNTAPRSLETFWNLRQTTKIKS
jgi:hypothetical protein